MRKNILLTRVLIILILVCCACLTSSVKTKALADNGTMDTTYTIDSDGNLIPTQHAYLFDRKIDSFNCTNSTINTFSDPQDIYYEESLKKYYICDTRNKRVLVFEEDLETAFSVGDGILDVPNGVFTTPDGDIYVADYGIKKVVVFSYESNYQEYRTFGKPDHPLYGETVEFKPNKITVDSNKTMYIVDAGNASGIVQITNEGKFSGYFGANTITPNFRYIIKFMFSSKKQRENLYRSPIAPTNLSFDEDGLLITITSGLEEGALKRLNIAGSNMFTKDMFTSVEYQDVCVGPTGVLITIDKSGYINEFDKEGNLLFTFGGKDSKGRINGLFVEPKSIEVTPDFNLYVLDKDKIQVFTSTEFSGYVHEALALYNDGKYAQSHAPWEKVLKMNNMFDLAHSGLGKAYLREMQYEKALVEFKISKDVAGYSEAFWEVRNVWITKYTPIIIISVAVLYIAILIIKKTKLRLVFDRSFSEFKEKTKKVKLIDDTMFLFRFIKKPLNGFYEIKYHKRMSVLAATIWYIILFIIMIFQNTSVGFIFNTTDIEEISILQIFSLTVLPILLFVVTNYLISSITVGSGRLRDVYVGTICSFAPVICFMPFVIILSNALTLNESFLYTTLQIVLWGWSFLLLYFMIKDIQELQVGENNKNIILTALTMCLFVAFAFLVYILASQVFTFLKDIILEGISNG